MNTIISIGDDDDYINKINLDELYEKKQQKDLKTNYKKMRKIHHTNHYLYFYCLY